MDEYFRGNEYRTTTVCIDSYEDGVPIGRFYNLYCPEGKSFASMSRFLTSMEDMLDKMQFPQPFLARRTFSDMPLIEDNDSVPKLKNQYGKLGTFKLRILFRQNADWQGSVAWVEGDRDESFRGVLELILLMDSALKMSV